MLTKVPDDVQAKNTLHYLRTSKKYYKVLMTTLTTLQQMQQAAEAAASAVDMNVAQKAVVVSSTLQATASLA